MLTYAGVPDSWRERLNPNGRVLADLTLAIGQQFDSPQLHHVVSHNSGITDGPEWVRDVRDLARVDRDFLVSARDFRPIRRVKTRHSLLP